MGLGLYLIELSSLERLASKLPFVAASRFVSSGLVPSFANGSFYLISSVPLLTGLLSHKHKQKTN